MSGEDLIARLRDPFDRPANAEKNALLGEASNALEAAEQTIAGLQAVIAEAQSALAHDGERDYLERIYATTKALAQSPTDTLEAVKAAAWDEGFDAGERDVHQHETFDEPCIPNPYRAASIEGEKS